LKIRRIIMGTATQFLPLVLLVFLMYFLLIRPQKRREKETAAMRNSVRVGDEVITIGGLRGRIVKTRDESLVIEVGADKLKFEIMRWAISKIETKSGRDFDEEEDSDTEGFSQKKVMPKRMKKVSKAAEEEKKDETSEDVE